MLIHEPSSAAMRRGTSSEIDVENANLHCLCRWPSAPPAIVRSGRVSLYFEK